MPMESSPKSMFKVNTDAAIFKDEDTFGLGMIIRDDKGEVAVAKCRKEWGIVEVLRAEFLVMVEGVKLPLELGL